MELSVQNLKEKVDILQRENARLKTMLHSTEKTSTQNQAHVESANKELLEVRFLINY